MGRIAAQSLMGRIGPAIFEGGWALSQLWLFLVAPIVGAAAGGLLYRFLLTKPRATRKRPKNPHPGCDSHLNRAPEGEAHTLSDEACRRRASEERVCLPVY